MRSRPPVLEIRSRKGEMILRAEGLAAICAAVSLKLIQWAGILIMILGVPSPL